MRKMLILTVIIIVASATVAVASWQVTNWIRGDDETSVTRGATPADVVDGDLSATTGDQTGEQPGDAGSGVTDDAGEEGETLSGETAQYDDPEQRYITETQRHQNFFIALGEGRVSRLDVIATDFQPAGDANTSYLYVIITTTDGEKSDGTIVMKYGDGLWRIATVRLSGTLAGGTEYVVPKSFEADLASELVDNQHFLRKTAEGRLAYLRVDNVEQVGESETILTGEVGSVGGNTWPTEMRLRKDYGLWHMTNIKGL